MNSNDVIIRFTIDAKFWCSALCLLDNGILLCYTPSNGLFVYLVASNGARLLNRTSEKNIVTSMVCSSAKKAGDEECLVSYGFGDVAAIGTFREDVPVTIEMRSDPLFRGCTGLWMLRRYNSDKHHSVLAVSFVKSTMLLKLTGEGNFEDASEFYGVDMYRQTLAIENAEVGSFLIQVCPDRILICKSNFGEEAGEFLADWKASNQETEYCFTSAVVVNDHVFALDVKICQLVIFQCRTTRGSTSIALASSITVGPGTSAFAVYGLGESNRERAGSPRVRPGFIIAFTAGKASQIGLLQVLADENSTIINENSPVEFSDFVVNELQFTRGPFGPRLIAGGREGQLAIFSVSQDEERSVQLVRMTDLKVGNRPVQLLRARFPGLHASIFALSGPASLVVERESGIFTLLQVLPRADHMVRYASPIETDGVYRFIAIEHESMAVFRTILQRVPRLEPSVPIICARHVMTKLHGSMGQITIVVGSPNKAEQDSPYLLGCWTSQAPTIEVYSQFDDELLFSTTLASGDVVTCASLINNSDLVAVGLQVQNVGQVQVFKIPVGTDRARRRSLPAGQTRGGVPQLVFAYDRGFPHPITAVTDLGELGGVNRILIAAGPELHIVQLDRKDHCYLWREDVHAVAAAPGATSLIAISTLRGGLELYAIDEDAEEAGISDKKWSCPLPCLVNKLLWCGTNVLAASDRRGFVHLIDTSSLAHVKWITVPLDDDIPCAIAYRSPTNSLIVATITGAVVEIPLPLVV